MKNAPKKLATPWPLFDTEDEFSDFTEALLQRKHADAPFVWSPDDSGGDGGIDCIVSYPDRTIIYQFKFYTDRLTSSPPSRKTQIRKSFIAAAKKKPDIWVLLFPCHINDTMRQFVEGLPHDKKVIAEVSDAGGIKVEIMDLPKLNALLAQHPDLTSIIHRDELLEQAAILNQERAVLAGGASDIASRAQALNSLANGIDPDWTVDHGVEGGIPFIRPRAKHQHAKPISQTFRVTGPRTEPQIQQFESVVRFGAKVDELVLPGQFVELTDYKGPDFLRPSGTISSLRFIHIDQSEIDPSEPITITLRDEHDDAISNADAEVTYIGNGTMGYTLHLRFDGCLEVMFSARYTGGTTDLTVKLNCSGLKPSVVRDTGQLCLDLLSAQRIVGTLRGNVVIDGNVTPGRGGADDPYAEEVARLVCCADDLDAVQSETRTLFAMPKADYTARDILWLRAARIMLAGGVSPVPTTSIPFTKWNDVAEEDDDTPRPRTVTGSSFNIQFADRTIPLPKIVFLHPKATVSPNEDRGAGAAADKYRICAPDGQPLFAYLPDRLTDLSGSVTPLHLGFPESEYPSLPPFTASVEARVETGDDIV